jgi:DNA modification methylase
VTERNDIVLDPTAGSGTTLVAAHRTKRRGYGIEIDPAYVDMAVRRMEKITKAPAHLAGTDLTFEHVSVARMGESLLQTSVADGQETADTDTPA